MGKEESVRALFHQLDCKLGVSINDFKKCLVHISVFENLVNNKNTGNSRFVFLGMYAFKGVLASLVSKYISGSGKQLQQFLGNAFSNDSLSKIYDDLQLGSLIKIHPNLDPDSLKHIFAQAYLGFVYENCSEEFIKSLAYQYFIKPNGHFIPKTFAINSIQILKTKTEQILHQKIKIIKTIESGVFTCKVLTDSKNILGEHSSVSETYAKKKAVKLALKQVLEMEAQNPEHQALIARNKLVENEKLIREKSLKQKKHDALIVEKKANRLIKKEKIRIEAKEREFKRTLNKANAKKKVDANANKAKNIKFDGDITILSANKRRHLEDKLK